MNHERNTLTTLLLNRLKALSQRYTVSIIRMFVLLTFPVNHGQVNLAIHQKNWRTFAYSK